MTEKHKRYEACVREYLRRYLGHEAVEQMKKYIQHGDVSTLFERGVLQFISCA